MSNRIMLDSPNNSLAMALASSVLPTPVGPTNKNTPHGLCVAASPRRWHWMAAVTALMAWVCPRTFLHKHKTYTGPARVQHAANVNANVQAP